MLEALVAACAAAPRTLGDLLEATSPFAPELKDRVLSGLAVFDEHNAPGNLARIHAAFEYCRPEEVPVFRILDSATREISLKPVRAGVVLFNLRDKRIVQLQNTYAEIQRKGRIRVPRTGRRDRRASIATSCRRIGRSFPAASLARWRPRRLIGRAAAKQRLYRRVRRPDRHFSYACDRCSRSGRRAGQAPPPLRGGRFLTAIGRIQLRAWTYSTIASSCSGVNWPWKGGISGWKPGAWYW